jgi:pimeloyl-ACP methyl ester carboxylesterase
MHAAAETAKPPHLFWTLTEGRWMVEYGAFRLARRALKDLPKGDGHPVLFLPGFLAGDASTKPMRSLFADLGYEPHGWGLGQNLRFNEHREREMADLVTRLYQRAGRKISIVGWSLGGVFARELAKMHPEKVRAVISLGSPISNDRSHSSARHLFEAINGKEPHPMRMGRYLRLDEAPPVPTTSILTKGDGIVHWRGSLQHADRASHQQVENIIVPASHVGLGLNPLVMVVIADRLAQKEGRWEKFDRSGWRSAFFQGA